MLTVLLKSPCSGTLRDAPPPVTASLQPRATATCASAWTTFPLLSSLRPYQPFQATRVLTTLGSWTPSELSLPRGSVAPPGICLVLYGGTRTALPARFLQPHPWGPRSMLSPSWGFGRGCGEGRGVR